MFETIKRIYKKTGNAELVRRAVEKGWISREQACAITGEEATE